MVGGKIPLQLRGSFEGQTAEATILKVFEPFTLSCVMVVRLSCSELASNGEMVLKIFDRRFASQLREDQEASPWTPDVEKEYHQFAIEGGASSFTAKLNSNDETVAQQGDTRNDSQTEAFLQHLMSESYDTEVEVYNTLKDIQGEDIPQLFANITTPIASDTQVSTASRYIDPPGILLQYITGFELADITDCAPKECWQSIGEEAMRVVNVIGGQGILNEDVKRRNFIVQKQEEDVYKVFMIDFALCLFRHEFEDDAEWDEWKALQDEEGAVGYVMQGKLEGGFTYHRSARYEQLDEDWNMEGGPKRPRDG